ncbi:NADH dehydrogenase [ubiquinone] 1 alpha subcomplex assembly factor 5, partial [Tremellales sp. Uapishka_1]
MSFTPTLRPLRSLFPRSRFPAASSSIRSYASLSPHTPAPTQPYQIFDEGSKLRQRDRAILRLKERGEKDGEVGYLREEIAERLAERIEDLRIPPSSILDLSSHTGTLTKILQETLGDEITSTDGVVTQGKRKWWMVDGSEGALHRDGDAEFTYPPTRIQTTASDLLSHPEIQQITDKVEAVVSASGLHWVGDIVGALTQIKHVLQPNGVFVGAVLGGDTLFELRTSLQLAEQERRGGIANRVSPMIEPTDAPSLLNRAGFTLTTIDVEDLVINYPSVWELMSDLRDMGESNAILGRKAAVGRDVLLAAEGIYKELYGNEDGSVPATFSIIFMIGWKPGPNQPQPLERGSGKTNLKDVL